MISKISNSLHNSIIHNIKKRGDPFKRWNSAYTIKCAVCGTIERGCSAEVRMDGLRYELVGLCKKCARIILVKVQTKLARTQISESDRSYYIMHMISDYFDDWESVKVIASRMICIRCGRTPTLWYISDRDTFPGLCLCKECIFAHISVHVTSALTAVASATGNADVTLLIMRMINRAIIDEINYDVTRYMDKQDTLSSPIMCATIIKDRDLYYCDIFRKIIPGYEPVSKYNIAIEGANLSRLGYNLIVHQDFPMHGWRFNQPYKGELFRHEFGTRDQKPINILIDGIQYHQYIECHPAYIKHTSAGYVIKNAKGKSTPYTTGRKHYENLVRDCYVVWRR